MKNIIKKTIKFVSSRVLYFLIGAFLSIAIAAVYATVTTVSSGDTLTAELWNEMAAEVNGIADSQWLTDSNGIYYDNGNVGIGTVSPDNQWSRLEVNGGAVIYGNLYPTVANTGLIGISGSGSGSAWDAYSILNLSSHVSGGSNLSGTYGLWHERSTGNFAIHHSDQGDLFTITKSGEVGIGTAELTQGQLVVKSSVKQRPVLVLDSATSDWDDCANLWFAKGGTTKAAIILGWEDEIGFWTKPGGVWQENVRITEDGKIGIGTNNPGSYKLYVSGTAYSTGGWQSSDIRFKKNITGIESALDKVLDIDGVLFEWNMEEYKDKGFPAGNHYGVIAQEIEKIIPEVVKQGPEGEKAVSYTELVPLLIEAVKEQQGQIYEQQKQIEEQQAQNNVKQKQIDELKQAVCEINPAAEICK